MSKKGFSTTNLHSDRRSKPEHGVLHKPVHPSVAYGYDDARHLAEVFQGTRPGYNYGRQLNPTVTALQDRVTSMEQGRASVAFATGMAAIGSTFLSLLKAGDHIISSAFLFGNTNSLLLTMQTIQGWYSSRQSPIRLHRLRIWQPSVNSVRAGNCSTASITR